jgi:hypothetical protein
MPPEYTLILLNCPSSLSLSNGEEPCTFDMNVAAAGFACWAGSRLKLSIWLVTFCSPKGELRALLTRTSPSGPGKPRSMTFSFSAFILHVFNDTSRVTCARTWLRKHDASGSRKRDAHRKRRDMHNADHVGPDYPVFGILAARMGAGRIGAHSNWLGHDSFERVERGNTMRPTQSMCIQTSPPVGSVYDLCERLRTRGDCHKVVDSCFLVRVRMCRRSMQRSELNQTKPSRTRQAFGSS